MKPTNLKTLGFVLLLIAIIVALVLQATGLGLVTREVFESPVIQTTTFQGGTVTTTMIQVGKIHLMRAVPIAALGVAGLVCILAGWLNGQQKLDREEH